MITAFGADEGTDRVIGSVVKLSFGLMRATAYPDPFTIAEPTTFTVTPEEGDQFAWINTETGERVIIQLSKNEQLM